MKRILASALILFLFFGMAGCATLCKNSTLNKKINGLKQELAALQSDAGKNTAQIKQLQDSLNDKEAKLKEKDAKIEELKEKLKAFGVFGQ
ncbi:MAG: hypothetical protein PHN57_00700 [Candidatus Omnitrophica bacterium]|nr:hypothetical protein [Candidatus Omnitrophota bacterium]